MSDTKPNVTSDLWALLHPADDRDVPVPGFPSGRALVAWAQEQPRGEMIDALQRTLQADSWPQQYAAMAALRELGLAVRGLHTESGFSWEVAQGSGQTITIRPHDQADAGTGEASAPREDGSPSATAPAAEAVVSEEKLRVLLAEQHESVSLDYKREADLSDKRTVVELAKDVAAMQVEGGFIVIGADDHGHPTGLVTPVHASLFNEARLRPKLRRWLPEPFDIRSARHVVDGSLMVLVYVGPNPAGFVVTADDGRYDNKQPLVFRRGDVFVRHGTASEVWNQKDIDRIIDRRVAKEKEGWRSELSEEIRRLGVASVGAQVATGPIAGVTWQLDSESFDAVILELLRRNDDVPLRVLLGRAAAEADRLLDADAGDDLETLLDRLLQLGSFAAFTARDEWVQEVLVALAAIYERGFRLPSDRRRAILWMNLMARLFALGGLVVRSRRWSLLRDIVLQQPRGLDQLYLNWIRHAHTQAARAELPGPDDEGRERHLSFIDLGARVATRVEAARVDGASDDDVLDSVAQLDALATLIAGADRSGTDREYRAYYPTFHLWYSRRVEPALAQVISDPDLRATVVPAMPDRDLAQLFLELARPPSQLWSAAPWGGYESPDLTGFIARNTSE